MTNIYQKLVIAVFSASLNYGFLAANPAEAVTYRLDWTGQTLGYKAKGLFSYDETKSYLDGIVRKDDLQSFNIGFFDPKGNLIQEFIDNQRTTPDFNFNFDTKTRQILQNGFWNAPDGISVGGARNQGLNFWSIPFAPNVSFPDNQPSPHVHLTDWGKQFALPIGFREHLDVAFFTRTTTELLKDPQAGSAFGQRLVASKVPEPSAILGLAAFSLAGLLTKKKGIAFTRK
ncbi:MAG: hypothetical protein KME31_05445 [Tolypothrix carrinoi HA7290-LM1]|jgi:hypothetical protein|nr:hypothetical protein [Tolypothrix carrinoi HA7290-LM1]